MDGWVGTCVYVFACTGICVHRRGNVLPLCRCEVTFVLPSLGVRIVPPTADPAGFLSLGW